MVSMAGGSGVQYTHPPVRATIFTVYFKPIDLDLSVIAELRDKWTHLYPGFKQAPPRHRPGSLLPTADLFSMAWPMPAAEMADSSLSRTLAFQFDQFSLAWRFDADEGSSSYPGYEALVNELIEQFSEFAAVVDSSSDSSMTVEGCRCFYTNTLEGVSGQAWLTSLLTGQTEATDVFDDAAHFGFRVRRNDDGDGTKREVTVQMDAGSEHSPRVDISAVAVPDEGAEGSPVNSAELAHRLMRAAHNLQNKTFESSFSEAMKKDWEAKS